MKAVVFDAVADYPPCYRRIVVSLVVETTRQSARAAAT